ncbi:MAG: S24 family peptidase [Pseudomonadota bacterium]
MFGLRLVKICGDSMAPVLPDGSYTLFSHAFGLTAEDIVLVEHEQFGTIVKAIARIHRGQFSIKGLSPRSTDEKVLGPVWRHQIIGKLRYTVTGPGKRLRTPNVKTA